MLTSNWRHIDDLSFNQFDSVILLEDTCFSHTVVVVNSQAMTLVQSLSGGWHG